MTKILGIDIGGTHTRWGIVKNHQIENVQKIKTKNIDDFVEFVTTIVNEYNDIEMISIGVPGIVNHNKIINIPNVKHLNIRNLDDLIKEKTNIDVIIHRDVRLLFAYDIDRLNLKDKPYVLGFYLGTGIGNVIKAEGVVLEGSHGFSAELGHIPVANNDKVCGCGKVGCSETLYSGKALEEIYNTHKLSGDFKDIFVNHANHSEIINFVNGFVRLIAIEMNLLDATTIIIGGGVANMKGFPKEKISVMLANHLRSDDLKEDLNINFVDDSPMNSIIGASLLALAQESSK
jgi:allose kinase